MMLSPAFMGYIILFEGKKNKNNKLTFLEFIRDKKLKKICWEFYIPSIFFIFCALFGLYMEVKGHSQIPSFGMYTLFLLLYPNCKLFLNRPKLFKNFKKKNKKNLKIIFSKICVEILVLMALSIAPICLVWLALQFTDLPAFLYDSTDYLKKLFLLCILFLCPSTIFLYKPSKTTFFTAIYIGVYIILILGNLYKSYLSHILEKNQIADYSQILIFNKELCTPLKLEGLETRKLGDGACEITENYQIKNNLRKDRIILTINRNSISKAEIEIKKEEIKYKITLITKLPKNKDLEGLVKMFAIINKLSNFSVSMRSSINRETVFSSYFMKKKSDANPVLLLGKKSLGLQLGLLLSQTQNLLSLNDFANEYMHNVEGQSFEQLLQRDKSGYIFNYLITLLSSSLEHDLSSIYRNAFSSMRLSSPTKLAINLSDLSNLFSYLHNYPKNIKHLINIGYFQQATLNNNEMTVITSNYKKNNVLIIYNNTYKYAITFATINNDFDLSLNNLKILHLIDSIGNLKQINVAILEPLFSLCHNTRRFG